MTFVAMVLAALTAFAGAVLAVPNLIQYQGRLTDAAGAPLTGSYNVVFSLYAAATGGVAVYADTITVTANNGLFNVVIGARPTSPIGAGVFNGSDRFLGIKVGTDLEMSPRWQITSVGYAVRSGTAEGITFAITTGQIADGAVTTAKIVDGAVTTAKIPDGAVTTAKIVDGAVINAKIADASVTAAKVADGSLSSLDLTTSYAHTGCGNTTNLGNAAWVNYACGSVTITTPGPGYIIVDGNFWLLISHTNGIRDGAYVGIATTPTAGPRAVDYWAGDVGSDDASGTYYRSGHVQAQYAVGGAGTYTYYLNGDMVQGWDAGDVFWFSNMGAVYYYNASPSIPNFVMPAGKELR